MTAPTTPPTPTVTLTAWHLDGSPDPALMRRCQERTGLLRPDPLVVQLDAGRFLTLTRFGVAVFWNAAPEEAVYLADRADRLLGFPLRGTGKVETFTVALNDKDEAGFERIAVAGASPARVALVSLAFAQSIALERFEADVDAALDRLGSLVESLRAHGRVFARVRHILKIVGFAVATKHAVVANLALLDTPDETWDSEDLERLYRGLHDVTFDLADRTVALTRKLDFLEEAVRLLLEVVQTRRSLHIEVAIVVLIAAEIGLALGGAW